MIENKNKTLKKLNETKLFFKIDFLHTTHFILDYISYK